MRGQLAQQVQAILGQSALVIITERVDDVGSVAKFDFWGKIQKSGIRNSTTYRLPNSRKSNFATEPFVARKH